MDTQTMERRRNVNVKEWMSKVIKDDEIDKYLVDGKDFIDDDKIHSQIGSNKNPDKSRVRDIIAKAKAIQLLTPEETAVLLNVEDPELWDEIDAAAGEIKRKVYDNRIVTFAPFYVSNYCVNGCLYCGFRDANTAEKRRILTMDEIRAEARAIAAIGHKRTILVFGEHPYSDAYYMADAMEAVYGEKIKTRRGYAQIRRANVNAAPLSIDDYKILWQKGIGTYQIFQETYHHGRYKEVHPYGIKANYRWRLYSLHRALDAGIDDVAIGTLFGLYDWRFEVMSMVYHAHDLENRFGVGPHTVSFPRLNPAEGTNYNTTSAYKVSDADFLKLIAVLRLAIPYAGMIITARETPEIRRKSIPLGITQTDCSSRIGIGAYAEQYNEQEMDKQQFLLGDTRGLDDMIREFAEMGLITSFCTAGYRCGRTGDKIMTLLKSGVEGKFCKLNAVLTFREWLDDFASEETRKIGEELIKKEMAEVKADPFFSGKKIVNQFEGYYERISDGERDLYL